MDERTGRKRFRGMVKRLAAAFAPAVPQEKTREVAPHLAFFQRSGDTPSMGVAGAFSTPAALSGALLPLGRKGRV